MDALRTLYQSSGLIRLLFMGAGVFIWCVFVMLFSRKFREKRKQDKRLIWDHLFYCVFFPVAFMAIIAGILIIGSIFSGRPLAELFEEVGT